MAGEIQQVAGSGVDVGKSPEVKDLDSKRELKLKTIQNP